MLCIYNSKHPEELSRISFCLFLSLCFSLRLAPTSGPRQEVYLLPNSKCKQVSKYGNMTGARCRYVVPHELQITSIDDRPSLCSLLEPHHRLANQLAWVWSICSRHKRKNLPQRLFNCDFLLFSSTKKYKPLLATTLTIFLPI